MRRSDLARGLVKMAAVGLALTACNNPAPATDAGHMGLDTGADAGGPPVPMLPSAIANSAPAGVSCVGTSTQPAGGASIDITMDLIAFGQNGDHAPNTHLCFCPTNVIDPLALTATGGCGACQDVTTDASGHAAVMAQANGWYGYRVFGHHGATPGTTFLDSVQINEQAPAASGGTVMGNAVTQLTENLILAAELLELAPGTTTIAGRLGDCAGNDISHAVIRAFRENGDEIIAGTDLNAQRYAYFDGQENPDAYATWTNTDGLYVVVNVPAMSGERVRVEAWANTSTGIPCTTDADCTGGGTCDTMSANPTMECLGASHRIGCEAVESFPDGVSIVNVGPTRNDYPADHPCH